MTEPDIRRTENVEEVGKGRARDIDVCDMHNAGKILVFEVLGEVSRVLSEEVEQDPEERALNLESPQLPCDMAYTESHTLILTISSRINRVGCSSSSSSGLFVEDTSLIGGISSKDMSEEEMLLIVGVGGSGGRFSMAS
jgi:hypothetical protein